jgi:hypothetical protein
MAATESEMVKIYIISVSKKANTEPKDRNGSHGEMAAIGKTMSAISPLERKAVCLIGRELYLLQDRRNLNES